ncbi:class I SAM-dependent methyltransferase [Dinghuibacter silviterrae]|uniref:Methyltransferase family protein n=1 Tax=Dinghuibacter silviterrae TaxID=1539049 RepID=A0A4R8DSH6_9BACT|nr:class I SAM-dependent methyltransferase [Dinghuibacter silviterrae]TDX01212.1 methyltransferase family protein [Dinghuibacter silviterrae]
MDTSSLNPTQRFSDRVDNYVKYRPTYPQAIIAFLRDTIHLNRKNVIADIGSGTGIFTDLLLRHGFTVIGVEPNQAMREAGDKYLAHFHHFTSRDGRAEATGLEDKSVDLITAAQAFHWMDPGPTRLEFDRILKPGGHVLLVWNVRLTDTPFLRAIEDLKRNRGNNYDAIHASHANEEKINAFFAPAEVRQKSFRHDQIMDFEAIKGQLLSSSYMPQEGQAGYDEMIVELGEIFQKYNENGVVHMEYETRLFLV